MVWIVAIVLAHAPTTAQNGSERTAIDDRFFAAVTDSAIKYEMLKPRMYNLQKSYSHLEAQLAASMNEARFTSYSHQIEKDNFATQIKAEKRKRRASIVLAFGAGMIIGALIK